MKYPNPAYACLVLAKTMMAAAALWLNLALAVVSHAAPREQTKGDGDSVLFSKDGRHVLVTSQGQPVRLKNNPNAKDVPLQKVVEFVKANNINTRRYEAGKFVCTEFAVNLHDAAEAAGIRCALVSLKFQQGAGHALNAFKTTDKGLVYVDCTGSSRPVAEADQYDTIGYLQEGRPYGRLPLEIGAFDPARYERYTYVMGLWQTAATEQARLRSASRKLSGADYEKQRAEIYTRYEQNIAQFKRLGWRYEMNTSPVKTIEIWW